MILSQFEAVSVNPKHPAIMIFRFEKERKGRKILVVIVYLLNPLTPLTMMIPMSCAITVTYCSLIIFNDARADHASEH